MAHGIQEVIETYGITQDPQAIDLILDKACYKDINIETSGLDNDFVKGYIALKIDAINLKSFIRAKEINKSRDFFPRVYMEGGNIPERLFIGDYDEAPEQFAEKLGIYRLRELLLEGLTMIRETGRFTALEKLCDDMLMEYVKDAKYASFGIEPLIAYMAARESDIKTVRIIMSGKLAHIPSKFIRERIRNTYV
jgi:V/A-type H+-transporting ATPase subunit C